MSGSCYVGCQNPSHGHTPYRTPAEVPPMPVPYREPPWKRLAYLLFLVAGPVITVFGLVEAGEHRWIGPTVLLGVYALVAQVVVALALFDGTTSFSRQDTRRKLALTFWALPVLTWFLLKWTWDRLCSLGRWVRDGEQA